MKSIMEEASSIIKAIEKGWIKAGSPKEFSVKIFEEPQKNFIGMTVKSAKIGIFFSDSAIKSAETTSEQKHTRHNQRPKTTQPQPREQYPKPRVQKAPVAEAPTTIQQNNLHAQPDAIANKQEEPKYSQPVWTEAMIATFETQLKQTLELMELKDVGFTIEPSHFHLKIYFKDSVLEDKAKEKQLFASFATLFLQMLKQKYRRPLKGYKMIFIGA